jgi:hypothetical protein
VDDIAVSRWVAETGGSTLVRLRLTNDQADPVAVRVVEELPGRATNALPMTTTGDEIDNWRRVGDRIVHEFAMGVGQQRTSAYLIRSEDEPPLSLKPPTVDAIEPVEDASRVDTGTVLEPIDSIEGGTADSRSDVGQPGRQRPPSTAARIGVSPEGTLGDDGPDNRRVLSEPVERSVSDEPDADAAERRRPTADASEGETGSILDRLIEALEEDATAEQRRALRAKLGASESERARLDHVRSRLDDLDAYIDALEELIDAHGVDVVDEMRTAIDENAATTASLEDEVATIEDELENHRDETTASLEAIESEMTAIWSGLSDRLESVESELNATRSALTELQDDVESDRQSRAREVRRFDKSISEIEETLERVEDRLEENDAFRLRFTAAFTSGSEAFQDDLESAESDETDAETDAD